MEDEDKLECEECGKDVECLFSKSAYQGNKETRDFCIDCYKLIHEEEF